ncbi:hypothetical protein C666_02290 [Thauera linaloolentis 47Lol = DSM 12138]|uniref:Uncharacterized protein n=1 Tax=Thauera linaloolentis (strain DSM 12138 / JCM 21573 / CCUG 41526 / CIP 105981 / IAM 15112 / NBRC 102519 / 47Lol) TaxID=1123367 RepID=N6Y7J3_THAL4|nr:hypothetical protein C666_02290 [Thauera linaloolentis 47Lol = DSM 12138]
MGSMTNDNLYFWQRAGCMSVAGLRRWRPMPGLVPTSLSLQYALSLLGLSRRLLVGVIQHSFYGSYAIHK